MIMMLLVDGFEFQVMEFDGDTLSVRGKNGDRLVFPLLSGFKGKIELREMPDEQMLPVHFDPETGRDYR
jgi:hypothetical protein